MRTPSILLITAGACALAGASVAVAQHRGAMATAAIDANQDGIITLAEAKAHGAERFARMDADGNGALTPEDRSARTAERFAQADGNGDGEVTPAEMAAARQAREAERDKRRAEREARLFARLDSDNSGGLSQAEMAAGAAVRREHRGARAERAGRGEGGHGGMALMRRADANRDNAVSRAEFDAAIEARFARLETDQSGTITAAEREAAKARWMERPHRGAGS